MPVPPRQHTPALLQVDAILLRLSGASAIDEVCRYVGAELPQFATLAAYRTDGTTLHRLTNAEGEGDPAATRPATEGAAGRCLAEQRSAIGSGPPPSGGEAPSEIAVPVLDGGRAIGVLVAASRFSRSYDATDVRFLEQVAGKLRAPVVAASAASASTA